jgi:hypothetical protein
MLTVRKGVLKLTASRVVPIFPLAVAIFERLAITITKPK